MRCLLHQGRCYRQCLRRKLKVEQPRGTKDENGQGLERGVIKGGAASQFGRYQVLVCGRGSDPDELGSHKCSFEANKIDQIEKMEILNQLQKQLSASRSEQDNLNIMRLLEEGS